jgi:hypothetical protein
MKISVDPTVLLALVPFFGLWFTQWLKRRRTDDSAMRNGRKLPPGS